MAEALRRALVDVRDTLLENPVSPRVEAPADINLHYCRYVARTVVDRVGGDLDLTVLEDGGRGYVHTWIAHEGRHYDAECVEGVADYRDLPFFRRHPEAVVNVEPEDVDPATLRTRAMEPLYPEFLVPDPPVEPDRVPRIAYWRHAVVGITLGAALFAIGLAGEWAIANHLLNRTPVLETLVIDLELIGEVLVVVSPVIFFGILPAHRASVR